jgi:hypothetical protein
MELDTKRFARLSVASDRKYLARAVAEHQNAKVRPMGLSSKLRNGDGAGGSCDAYQQFWNDAPREEPYDSHTTDDAEHDDVDWLANA